MPAAPLAFTASVRTGSARAPPRVTLREAELEAKFAWTGGKMASFYTRSASREKLAVRAAQRTRNNT
jgi:hypothetical protein